LCGHSLHCAPHSDAAKIIQEFIIKRSVPLLLPLLLLPLLLLLLLPLLLLLLLSTTARCKLRSHARYSIRHALHTKCAGRAQHRPQQQQQSCASPKPEP
jgi:hypothetical protein